MATPNKTQFTDDDVTAFIHTFVEKEEKKQDSFQLIQLMHEWSGHAPKMYGPSIIGFGSYSYQYASGHKGEAPLIGFSPRKAAFTLYVTVPDKPEPELLDALGKYTISKACIYFKKLSDINLDVLEKLCLSSIAYVRENQQCGCR